MAVPVVASFEFAVTGAGGGTSTEVTVNKPSGVAVDDLLILLVGNEDNTSTTSFAAITGWTKEYEFGNATPDAKIGMYWRVADGTEAASETIDWSATGSDFGGAWYLRVTGADTTTPIHLLGTSSQTSAATSQAASSITTTIDDALVFAHHSFDGADGTHSVSGTNWPSAFPADQFIFDSEGTATAWCGGWVTQDLASAGASNNCTFTSSLSDGMVQVQFAVAPAAGGAINVGIASEADTAFALVFSKVVDVEFASETNTGFSATPQRIVAVGIASETDAGFAVAFTKATTVGLVSETNTAFTVTANRDEPIGLSVETNTALVVVPDRTFIIGQSSETGVAFTFAFSKSVSVGLASETSSAFPVAQAGAQIVVVAQALETDTALRSAKHVSIASETDTALGVLPDGPDPGSPPTCRDQVTTRISISLGI